MEPQQGLRPLQPQYLQTKHYHLVSTKPNGVKGFTNPLQGFQRDGVPLAAGGEFFTAAQPLPKRQFFETGGKKSGVDWVAGAEIPFQARMDFSCQEGNL